MKDCLDPKWQETSTIGLEPCLGNGVLESRRVRGSTAAAFPLSKASQMQYLEFEIWDQDVGSSEFLGKAVLNPRRCPGCAAEW